MTPKYPGFGKGSWHVPDFFFPSPSRVQSNNGKFSEQTIRWRPTCFLPGGNVLVRPNGGSQKRMVLHAANFASLSTPPNAVPNIPLTPDPRGSFINSRADANTAASNTTGRR